MAAYRRVYDSRHLQADCKKPGSAPKPYARQSSMGYLYLYFLQGRYRQDTLRICMKVENNNNTQYTLQHGSGVQIESN